MRKISISVFILALIAIGVVLVILYPRSPGWTEVPNDRFVYKQVQAEEVVIEGLLTTNYRIVFAVTKDNDFELFTEAGIDELNGNGSMDRYRTFHKQEWSHRLEGQDISRNPSYRENGTAYFLILSTGTETWRSSSVLREFENQTVEIKGKWDSYSSPDYPLAGSVVQFLPEAIRKVSK